MGPTADLRDRLGGKFGAHETGELAIGRPAGSMWVGNQLQVHGGKTPCLFECSLSRRSDRRTLAGFFLKEILFLQENFNSTTPRSAWRVLKTVFFRHLPVGKD
jgi:hypothetical protein